MASVEVNPEYKLLFHVKGKTNVQIRLVKPYYNSLNKGDCFILVLPNQLYSYTGRDANAQEVSQCRKFCAHILEHKDFSCCASREIMLEDGKKAVIKSKINEEQHWKNFWKLLDKPEDYDIPAAGDDDEDEKVEALLIKSNRVYEILNNELVPIKKYWGLLPKYHMLQESKVLLFDFGSEVFVWNGKRAAYNVKCSAIEMAKNYFDNTANIDNCGEFNAIYYAEKLGKRTEVQTPNCVKREEWCKLEMIYENFESMCFTCKFPDWEFIKQDLEKLRIKDKDKQLGKLINAKLSITSDIPLLENITGIQLLKGTPYEEPNLVLDNINLGRGDNYFEAESKRHYIITTKCVSKWILKQFDCEIALDEEYEHFYTDESYILRWIYAVTVTVRELSGNISKRSTVGLDRCAYFIWHGIDSVITHNCKVLLEPLSFDEMKGPEITIKQGEEIPAFVKLCKMMIIHSGSQIECFARRTQYRLYQMLGNYPKENILQEVPCLKESLRSRASMLIIHGEMGKIIVWHGCKSAQHTRKLAEYASEEIKKKASVHFFLTTYLNITIMEEERANLAQIFPTNAYFSLLHSAPKSYNYTPRLFHFFRSQGIFKCGEILSALRTSEHISPFPFSQAILYNATHPSIFMIDDGDTIWIWLTWTPNSSKTALCDNGAILEARQSVLEISKSYWHAKTEVNDDLQNELRGFVVWAGLEPAEFKNIFPIWKIDENLRKIAIAEGRLERALPIANALAQLEVRHYSLTALQQRPLPEGIDPFHLEMYLSDVDFIATFGMNKDAFSNLPTWKQNKLKKDFNIF